MKNLKNKFKKEIKRNIEQYGHHITVVSNGVEPRFAYTIGVSAFLGFELVFAGGVFFMQNDVLEIINNIVTKTRYSELDNDFVINSYGSFRLSKVHHSWSKLMMLGFFDFYETNELQALQIIPDSNHITLDVPDMSIEWDISSQPIWKWLSENWCYSVPESSKIITNIAALRGNKVTEVMRWKSDEWEAFAGAGPDVKEEDMRIVSMGTILGIDSSLQPILNLHVGKGIWRDKNELIWHEWS